MSIHRYVKAPPSTRPLVEERAGALTMEVRDGEVMDTSTVRRMTGQTHRRTVLSYLFILAGLSILSWALWPIVSFMVFSAPQFSGVISPVADGSVALRPPGVLSPLVSAASDVVKDQQGPDYTNANVWFPTSPQKKIVSRVTAYTLSIPKLRINNALVTISGDDLNKSLIHYGGTGLPGEYGTAVIFGHSVLPQFYNPTNYKTIFSTIPTLKIGDEIFIRYDGVEYRYVVYEMLVTEPNDLTPLAQRFDDSYVTLITCVPPGTYWKRLNVRARLEKI
ncbi:sortase [Candidatus Gottesmanbacteria bacterium]|nr:sortase [Candidatus Gottesmanbacteria bacterium]